MSVKSVSFIIYFIVIANELRIYSVFKPSNEPIYSTYGPSGKW